MSKLHSNGKDTALEFVSHSTAWFLLRSLVVTFSCIDVQPVIEGELFYTVKMYSLKISQNKRKGLSYSLSFVGSLKN